MSDVLFRTFGCLISNEQGAGSRNFGVSLSSGVERLV